MNPNDPLGLGGFNSQALHPDEASMNAGNLPARPQHAGPGGLEGWLVRNAPTIGGTIGAVAAAPLNLLDAVSGVGGTALDVGAAGLGADLGQRIKNKFDPMQATNPEKEGLIGAGSELGGMGLGSVLGKGVNALKGAAPDIFKAAFNVPNKLLSRLKPNETAQKMLDYGVGGSLNNIIGKSNSAMDILDGAYRDSIGQIKQPIDINPAIDAANRVIHSPYTTDLTEADKQKVNSDLASMGATGSLPFKLNPQDAVDSMRKIQQVGHTLLAKGENKLSPNPRLSQMGQSYLAAADQIQNQLDDLGGAASVKAVQSPENKAALSEISPQLASEFMNAKTPQEVRTLMAPFMNVKTMAKITSENPARAKLLAQMTGAGAGFGLGGIPGAVAGMVGSPAIEGIENTLRAPVTTTAARGVNAIAKTVGRLTANTGKEVAGKLTARDIVNKTLTQATGQGIDGLYGNKPQISGGPVSSMVSNQVGQVLNSASQQTQQPPIQMLTPDQISQILRSSGIEGLKSVEGAIDTNLAVQRQEYPELSSDQQGQIADITKALQGITDSAKLYEQAQALGAGSGVLAQLGTHIPGIQNTKSESALRAYEDNRGELAAQVATILGSGRSSASMIRQIESELPSPTDSPEAAQTKFSLLVTRLNNAMQSTLATPATNTPGQLTNFSGQSVPGLNTAEPPDMNLLNFVGAP